MEESLITVAAELARQFHDLPQERVFRVVTDCLDDYPGSGAHFIRQAAEARLEAMRGGHGGD